MLRNSAPAGRTASRPGYYPRKVAFMHRDDLLAGVRVRARLHGPNEARRVIRAVVETLGTLVPGPIRGLAGQLPADLGITLPEGASWSTEGRACRRFLRDVAARLLVDEAEAAFLSRVTLGELNAYCRGVTPARLAAMVPADLRPLLRAQPEEPAPRYQRVLQRTVPAAVTLRLEPTPARPAVVTAGAA